MYEIFINYLILINVKLFGGFKKLDNNSSLSHKYFTDGLLLRLGKDLEEDF